MSNLHRRPSYVLITGLLGIYVSKGISAARGSTFLRKATCQGPASG
jgi:hypothetical protein